jgi:hypothetical protein
MAVPDLPYPALRKWGETGAARLAARLDLFTDFLVLSDGTGEHTIVDPADIATALAAVPAYSGFLPPGCLFWGQVAGRDHLAIYLEPQIRTLSVRGEPEAWQVPLPGLVFSGYEYEYRLWAVKERPAAGAPTALYRAPCPNVAENVCRGSAPFPPASTTTIWQAALVFFSSRFNPDLGEGKSQAYPDNILEQWRALHRAGAQSYPRNDLLLSGDSLGDIT